MMVEDQPAVCILPSHLKLGFFPGAFALSEMSWPLGQPERLKGKHLRDLTPNDHLILHPRTTSYYRPGFGTRAKVSVMVVECELIHKRHIEKLHRFHKRFYKVLTVNEALIHAIPNGVLFPFGSTWVPNWQDVDVSKSKDISLIASAKRSQPGHITRHDIIEWANRNNLPVDAIGGGYQPFDQKSDGLAPYRYSVVIENTREINYFTEKLVDCILCNTVPIYYGAPNIERFFDTSGMILCKSEDDIKNAIRNATPELFAQLSPKLSTIRQTAAHYGDLDGRAAHIVLGTA